MDLRKAIFQLLPLTAAALAAFAGCGRQHEPVRTPSESARSANGLAAATQGDTRPTSRPAARTSIRIMTYNLYVNIKPSQAALDVMLKGDADVICLQEVSAAWPDYLRANLGERYPYMLFHKHPNGQGIISRLWMRELKYIEPVDGAWFPAILAEIDAPAGPMQVLDVHLRPNLDDYNNPLRGFFTAKKIHEKEVSRLAPQMDAKMPNFIAGDFNELASDPGMNWLQQHGFADARSAFADHSPTWHGNWQGISLTYSVDHILSNDRYRCVSAKVIAEGPSDHYPVVAEFSPR